ncbi:MAG: FtsX-like permease family protein [Pseudomonadota bacterium]|nr:FtsX-like permease family protein [Pseudomonadota bacterium]
MIESYALLIASRFIGSRHHTAFTKLTQRLAVIGISLGVAILIIITSIFNGVEEKIHEHISQMKTHIIAKPLLHVWPNWQKQVEALSKEQKVVSVLPQTRVYAVIQNGGEMLPIMLYASPSAYRPKWLPKESDDVEGPDLIPQAWIHESLKYGLYLEVGDKFSLITAKQAKSQLKPVNIRVEVSGFFDQSNLLEPLNNTIYMRLSDLNTSLDLPEDTISEIAITTTDIFYAPMVARELNRKYPDLIFEDWTGNAKTFLESLQIQKKMMIIVLSLVTCIASFNLVTGLVILVMDKSKEIAVLQTMGVSKRVLFRIFVLQGITIATIGALIGISIGLPIAYNLTSLVDWFENVTQIKLFSEQVFMLSYLPTKVVWTDLLAIGFFTEVLAFLAALYPARQALKIQPAKTLRHE